jgi:polysaccharide deacetylase family protein (PEP-CTERM system associated)
MAYATMSIDWEDFGQQYGKYHFGKITEPVNGSIERQTAIMLDLLDETKTKATFFILGHLAAYRKNLVKAIAARGHEIGLHSQNHEPMYTLSPEQAREDVTASQKIVTDITGQAVYGFRAPYFSLIKENLWLLETLAELGLTYDSSIFPVELPRYGIANFSPEDSLYRLPSGKEIVELPMTTAKFMNRTWPVAGGGYIRLMPEFLIKKVFRNFEKSKKDSMIYMHPYEFDSQKIEVSTNYPSGAQYSKLKVKALNLKWNMFRPSVTEKIKTLLQSHQFITCLQKAEMIKQNKKAVALNFTMPEASGGEKNHL